MANNHHSGISGPLFRNELIDELEAECASFNIIQRQLEGTSLQLDPDMAAIQNIQHMELQQWLEFSPAEFIRDAPVRHRLPDFLLGFEDDHEDGEDRDGEVVRERKIRGPNRWGYSFGDWMTSTFYLDWLDDVVHPGGTVSARNRTYEQSQDPRSTFRSWVRLTLRKVDILVDRFLREGWITYTKHCRSRERLQSKAEVLIIGSLCLLAGTVRNCRQFRTLTKISGTEHQKFFNFFVAKLYDIRGEFIHLPRNMSELKSIMDCYDSQGLPGCCGSMDVVHVRWANCPAGDFNRCKGKESYPSLAFQCISDNERRIIGVFGPQHGTRNDKTIVKYDVNVRAIRNGWYNEVEWNYFTEDGTIEQEHGVYLICDNGYLRWPVSICPYKHGESRNTPTGYFSKNLESVRKDVECVFGILKRRWGCLDRGFKHRSIIINRNVFVSCCILHNMMVGEREECASTQQQVRRGFRNEGEGIWLEGPTDTMIDNEPDIQKKKRLIREFEDRRIKLVHHLNFVQKLRRRSRQSFN